MKRHVIGNVIGIAIGMEHSLEIKDNMSIKNQIGIKQSVGIKRRIGIKQSIWIKDFRWIKASYSVEGALIIPIFLFMLAAGMKMTINMYQDICKEQEQEAISDLWLVDDFYKLQILNEMKGEKDDK